MRIKFVQNLIDLIRFGKTNQKSYGNNNTITDLSNSGISVCIFGNNNKVFIDKGINCFKGSIFIGTRDCPADNCSVEIGANATSNGIIIRLLEDNSKVKIGKDCMFSSNIHIDCTDTHSVYDIITGNLINQGKSINIGNHVWIGKNVTICKNTSIADNCVVGTGAIVTKEFVKSNCIIAGVPAKIIKENTNWSRLRPKQYIANSELKKR